MAAPPEVEEETTAPTTANEEPRAAEPPGGPGASSSVPDIRLSGLTKRYGEVVAVDGIDLEIAEGEFFTMLGPSGSGKTTTLRMIAGFEEPTSGTVELAGTDVVGLPPYDRAVNTVFQDYALFPHMTVGENVEYGLRVARVAKDESGQPPRRGAGDGAPLRLRRAQAERALRRPAPAGGAGAGDRQQAHGCCCSTSRWAPST